MTRRILSTGVNIAERMALLTSTNGIYTTGRYKLHQYVRELTFQRSPAKEGEGALFTITLTSSWPQQVFDGPGENSGPLQHENVIRATLLRNQGLWTVETSSLDCSYWYRENWVLCSGPRELAESELLELLKDVITEAENFKMTSMLGAAPAAENIPLPVVPIGFPPARTIQNTDVYTLVENLIVALRSLEDGNFVYISADKLHWLSASLNEGSATLKVITKRTELVAGSSCTTTAFVHLSLRVGGEWVVVAANITTDEGEGGDLAEKTIGLTLAEILSKIGEQGNATGS